MITQFVYEMKKVSFIFLVIIFLLGIYISFPQNHYLLKTLVHLWPNIDDYAIFENRDVSSSNSQPWIEARDYNQKAIPGYYKNYLDYFKTTAFLVVRDTAIVHESYYRGYSDTSYSNIFSMTKSIVSLLLGCALDDGSVKSIDDPVSEYIPEFNTPSNKDLTIKQLLTMSSGLNWDEGYSSVISATTKAYYGSELDKQVLDLKVTEKPGVQFKYLSCNTQLLAILLENATHKRISDYASEKLWKPLGAGRSALWSLDKPDGSEKAYCCFNTNARDVARLGQLVLNKGKWHGKQIVSEQYITDATQPADWLKDERGVKQLDYFGYHFWLVSFRGERVIYARGILGQYMFIIPSKNMVIVRFGEARAKLKVDFKPADLYIWLNLGMYLAGE